jgi:RNA 3'-terminal phosphate cyclase (ATP)
VLEESDVITIDGSQGEGGGQVLRTALALSLVTGKPFRIEKIRAGRKKPGLMRQHLTAANAAAEVSVAEVEGNAVGSGGLSFVPGSVKPGAYGFSVGTAGSVTLVLQTVLPALLLAEGPSVLTLEGGTHNPCAPPFEFLEKAFLPLVNQMGPTVTVNLERPGFYPAGGGRFTASIEPCPTLSPIERLERGPLVRRGARALVARLPRKIAERELRVLRRELSWPERVLTVEEVRDSRGPGNALLVEVECEHVTEVFAGIGQRGVPAERVAGRLAKAFREYFDAGVPVGKHLADQLLIPLALAGSGRYRTLRPTPHTTTNVEVVKRFLEVEVVLHSLENGAWDVQISKG